MTRHLLAPCILFGATLVGASPALSQPQFTPQSSPGIPESRAVDPAPGAQGPFAGAGPHAFYDTDARIAAVEQRAGSLAPRQRRRAMAAIRAIRAEERTQIARHGELRDWDRENLNRRLDQLVGQFPELRG